MTERIVVQRGTRVVVVGSSVVGPQGPAGGGGGVTDGNKGDITVSGAGTVWSFAADMATQAELDAVAAAKANTAHSHAEGDVTGLTAALAGKAPTVHTHAQADVTNLTADLAGKAPAVHTHAEGDVTGLTAALAGKVPTTRTISTTAPLTGGGDLTANRTLTVAAASDTAVGVVELATTAETTTGTDTTRAVTPAGVKAVSDLLIPKALVDAKGDLIVATANDTPARLAVGGTNGHVLTVDSGEATGLKWAAASGGGGDAGWGRSWTYNTSVRSYNLPGHFAASTTVADSYLTGNVYYWPIMVGAAITVEELVLGEVTTIGSAGATARIGIYEASDIFQPGTLVYGSATLAVDTLGKKAVTGLSSALAAGRYLLAMTCSATFSARGFGGLNLAHYAPRTTVGGGANVVVQRIWGALTYAALPTPGNAWTTINADNGSLGLRCPILIGTT